MFVAQTHRSPDGFAKPAMLASSTNTKMIINVSKGVHVYMQFHRSKGEREIPASSCHTSEQKDEVDHEFLYKTTHIIFKHHIQQSSYKYSRNLRFLSASQRNSSEPCASLKAIYYSQYHNMSRKINKHIISTE